MLAEPCPCPFGPALCHTNQRHPAPQALKIGCGACHGVSNFSQGVSCREALRSIHLLLRARLHPEPGLVSAPRCPLTHPCPGAKQGSHGHLGHKVRWDGEGGEVRTGVSNSLPEPVQLPFLGILPPKQAAPGSTALHGTQQHPARQRWRSPGTLPSSLTLLLSPWPPNTTATSDRLPRCSRGAGKAAGAAAEHNGAIDGRASGPGTAQWGLVCWPGSRSCPAPGYPWTPFLDPLGAQAGASPGKACLERAGEFWEGAAGGNLPGEQPLPRKRCPGKAHSLGNCPAW